MKPTSRIAAATLAGLVLAAAPLACSKTTAVRTAETTYDSVNWRDVQILTTAPDRPYEELGTLNTAGWKQKDTRKMHDELKKEAARWGADAVLVTTSGVSGVKDDQWSNATAIRFKRSSSGDAG
jgi:hypothetical protein